MWYDFQQFITKAAGKYNFTQTLKAIEICQACRELIRENLPPEAENNLTPKSFKDQVVTISAANSVWANQAQMACHRIHRSLKEKFGENTVKRIRIEMMDGQPG